MIANKLLKQSGSNFNDLAVNDDAAVLESLCYFSNLTSKVNDVMLQGNDLLYEDTTETQAANNIVTDAKILNEVLKHNSEYNKSQSSRKQQARNDTQFAEKTDCINTAFEYSTSTGPSFQSLQTDANTCTLWTSLFPNTTWGSQIPLVAQSCYQFIGEPQQLPSTSVQNNSHKLPDISSVSVKLQKCIKEQEQIVKLCEIQELANKANSVCFKNFEKGDPIAQSTCNFEDAKISTNHSSPESRRVRQTCSLSSVGSCFNNKDSNVVGLTSPCKRQRSATCLTENETSRRKL